MSFDSNIMGSQQMPGRRILIVGGGLGGLTLAQGLKNAQIPFHVFERDPNATWRPQGYRIRINGEGAFALQQSLPQELWERFEKTCAKAELGETDINAIDGAITACRAGGAPAMRGFKPYTADRQVLRQTLLTGLEEHMTFGKEFTKYEVTEDGVIAYFKDGSSYYGGLLVGADGNRSLIRKQYLPNNKPLDTEGYCIYGKTPITPELAERFPAAAMRWMTLVTDKTPMTQTLDFDETPITLLLEPIRFEDSEYRDQVPADYMYWVLIAKKHAFGISEDDNQPLKLSGAEAAKLSLKVTSCWDARIRSLLHLQDPAHSSLLKVVSANPKIAPWEPSSRVTLVGDAIHVMSPSGGVGAVAALMDGGNLAKTIAEKGISAASIGEYETKMREYAGMWIKRSFFGGRKLFGQQPFEHCKEFNY